MKGLVPVYFLSFLWVLLSHLSDAAKSFLPSDVPNPMLNPAQCGRPGVKTSAICDPENIMKKEQKDVIEGFINAVPNAQIAVVLVQLMSPTFIGQLSLEEAGEKFARALHDSWGVGREDKQDGVLIFVCVSARVVYISTGDGVKGKLTPTVLESYIVNEVMKPDLRQKEYGTAIEKAVVEIDNILSGKSNISAQYMVQGWFDSAWLKFVLFGSVVVFMFWQAWAESARMRRLEKGRKALDELMNEVSEGDANQFETKTCPICLEGFEKVDDVVEVLEGTCRSTPASSSPLSSSSSSGSGSGAGTGVAGAPGAKEKEKKSPRRPMKLQCGHLYCFGCLSEYLKTSNGTKCPVCRAPVNGDRPEPPPAHPPGGGGGGGGGGSGHSNSGTCAAGFPEEGNPSASAPTSASSRFLEPPLYLSRRRGHMWDHHSAQWAYRVHRMHTLYPEVMTAETVHALNIALTTGSQAEFQRIAAARGVVVNKTINDLQARAKAARSGSQGSSSGSFGGGRSSGGGGGRW